MEEPISSCESNSEDLSVSQEDVIERQHVARRISDVKKAQFKGFYFSQKTLIDSESLDGHGKSLDELDQEALDSKVPKIVKNLIHSREDDESDENTQHSDMPASDQDNGVIANNHKMQGFAGPLHTSTSCQSIRHLSKDGGLMKDVSDRNTSDEDLWDLPNGGTSKSDGELVNLTVTDRDYYAIRHESEFKNEKRFVLSFSPEKINSRMKDKKKRKKVIKKASKKTKGEENTGNKNLGGEENECYSSGEDTEGSNIVVTDRDYYTIRHENEFKNEKEFYLCFSPKKTVTRMQSCDERAGREGDSWIPSSDLPGFEENDTEEATSDEDVPCKEGDFMSIGEFMEAYETDFEFQQDHDVKTNLEPKYREEKDQDDENNTESLKESLVSDSCHDEDIDDIDQDTENEDMEYSDAGKAIPIKMDVRFSIEKTKSNDDQAAVMTKEKLKNSYKKQFPTECVVLMSDDDSDIHSEELEQKITNMIVLDEDDTDEENLPDLVDDMVCGNCSKGFTQADKMNKKKIKFSLAPEKNQSKIVRNAKQHGDKSIIEAEKLASRKGKKVMLPTAEVFTPSKGTLRVKSKQHLEVAPKPKRIKHRTVTTEEV